MNERSAHIDIVFRNGLKDIEALPPPEVWENIKPAIRKRQRPFILLSSAALIAVLVSLGILAYRWNVQLIPVTGSKGAVLSVSTSAPVLAPASGQKTRSAADYRQGNTHSAVSAGMGNDLLASAEQENADMATPELYSRPEVSLYENDNKPSRNSLMKVLDPVEEPSFEFKTTGKEYITGTSAAKPEERWSIAAMASPTYYSRFGTGTDDLSKQMNSSEEPMMSYSGGLALSYRINKRLSVQTGLYYSSIGQKVDGVISFGGFQPFGNTKGGHNFQVLTSSGTINTNNSDVFLLSTTNSRVISAYDNDIFDPRKENLQYINNSLRQDFSYLELPVVLRYKLVDRTLGFNLIGGVSYNFLVSNDVYTTYNGGKYQVGTTQGLNPFTLSSSLGMGMEYSFSKNLSLNLEPTFRYYINPFSSGSGLRNHPYSFGVFSGISYKF